MAQPDPNLDAATGSVKSSSPESANTSNDSDKTREQKDAETGIKQKKQGRASQDERGVA